MPSLTKKKLPHLTFVLLFVVMLALTACSGKENASEEPANEEEQEQTADIEQKEGIEEAVDKRDMKAEITLLTAWGTRFQEQFGSLIADFNRSYPNIKVTMLEQTINELAALVAADQTPDVVTIFSTMPAWREDNFLEDLTPYVESDPDVSLDMFYEPALNSFQMDGGLWGLPWQDGANLMVAYHPDIFDQYGFTEFPEITSLDEMNEFLKTFWTVQNGQQTMTTFFPHGSLGSVRNTLQTWAYMNGATTTTFYNPETRKVSFNDPLIVEALEWIVRFKRENIDDDRIAELDATLPENTNRFLAGKQSITATFLTDAVSLYKENPELGITTMPEQSLWFGGWGVGMSTGSKNKEAAWEFIKWMTSTNEGAESLLKYFGWISGKIENPYLEQVAQTDPVIKIAYEALPKVRHSHLEAAIPVDYFPEFDDKWAQVMQGTLEPKAFLDHMTDYIQRLIDEKYAQ
jgi:ABC-type glycerol-3-phosphate transport system substrate-binding protein